MEGSENSYLGGSKAGKTDKNGRILLVPADPVKKPKHQAPQDAIDEFWQNFNTKTPGKAFTVLPKNIHAKRVGEGAAKGTIEGENALASYEEAAKICKEKVAKIVKECRRVNQKYRDPHFDIEFDLKWGAKDCLSMLSGDTEESWWENFSPGSVKRVADIFDKPQFFVGGATANDIRQGRNGDCWFMAALCTLGNKEGLIDRVCVARDEEIGVYGFVFHRDGEWRSEVIDDKLYLTKPDYDESWLERNLIEDRQRINSEEDYRKIYQSNSGALYFAQCEDPNETWLPLLEKAYAKAHGDYGAIEGGFTGEALEDLTGGVCTELFSTDILDKEYFWKEELLKVNEEFLYGCASGIFGGRGDRKGVIEGHAYSIMRAVEIDGQRLCLLRNPWGQGEWTGAWSDGSKEWTPEWMTKLNHRFGDDGAFWMSYDDLLKKYQTFDRTRLFGPEWKVTQQWTSLTVPWSVDYHDTTFSFNLEKKAPVVIVLSQLDDRYFRGLEGEYRYELTFRVHKAGEEDYLVRSHGNYWMSRSVTAELELEEGEYHVLMHVKATKLDGTYSVEEVIRKNAKDKRDKLLRIGLAYDLAHAKGHFNETEEEKKAKKAKEDEKKKKELKELKEKLLSEKKRRKHVANKEIRKERIARAKRAAKAKAKAVRKAEKLKEAKAKEDAAKSQDVKVDIKTEVSQPTIPKEGIKPLEVDASTEDKVAPVAEATTADPISISEKPKEPATDSLKPIVPLIEVPSVVVDLTDIEDDFDDDSDLDSNVSDITDGFLEEELANIKQLEKDKLPEPTPEEEEEDDFQKNPWNAIAVVGLRVYCKGSSISVKVVRPVTDDEENKKVESGERKLDVDDSARDATKVEEDIEEKKESEQTDKTEEESKKPDGSEGSEESGVLV